MLVLLLVLVLVPVPGLAELLAVGPAQEWARVRAPEQGRGRGLVQLVGAGEGKQGQLHTMTGNIGQRRNNL